MAVPGIGCIGAYLTVPVCMLYGTAKSDATPSPTAAGALTAAIALTAGGPAVDVIPVVMTVVGKVPVMPTIEKRLENVVTVPPAVAVANTPKKLSWMLVS